MFNTLFLTLQLSNLLCFPLALADIRPWHLLPFFQISLKNSALKTTHNTFWGCRVHFIRRSFSKQLYISVGNCRAHYHDIFMHKDNLSTTSLHCVRAGCELRQQRTLDSRTRTTTSTRFNEKLFRVSSKNIHPGKLHCTLPFYQKRQHCYPAIMKEVNPSLDRKMIKLLTFDNLVS